MLVLITLLMSYNVRSNSIKSLALESMTLLAQWKELANRTDGLLLDRYTYFGPGSSPEIVHWERLYKDFGKDLEELVQNETIARQPQMKDRLEGAYRVWRFTEVQLNNARYYFSEIIKSGLGQKVMVNGMLHTMYQMRMRDQLSVQEIFLMEEAIYALESLEHATREFDLLFNAIVVDMDAAGEVYLKRVRVLFYLLFGAVFVIFILFFIFRNQLKVAQDNRKQYLESARRELLQNLCDESTLENIAACMEKKEELGLRAFFDRPLLLVVMQIDAYVEFSYRYNVHEQKDQIDNLRGMTENFMRSQGMLCESFCYRDDTILYLINADENDVKLAEGSQQLIATWFTSNSHQFPLKVTMTIGEFCYEMEDLDKDVLNCLKLSEYRYLMGTGSIITKGAWTPHPPEAFRYPLDKERLFEEAFKSLDLQATLKILRDMILYAQPYGPESMKRLVLRLTAAQSSVVELLEKSFNITVLEGVIPMILDIQRFETLSEAQMMMENVIERVISECLQRKHAKHDQTVLRIKEIIDEQLADFNLSADQIADQFNLTSSYINRIFKQQTAMSISGYINETRLHRADTLLRETDLTITQIAAQAGFSSMGTFFRLFKKHYGQTPGERVSGVYGCKETASESG
jgi:AraC-like DNA-binding protein